MKKSKECHLYIKGEICAYHGYESCGLIPCANLRVVVPEKIKMPLHANGIDIREADNFHVARAVSIERAATIVKLVNASVELAKGIINKSSHKGK